MSNETSPSSAAHIRQTPSEFSKLIDVVVDDARKLCVRIHDKSRNAARAATGAIEDEIEELAKSAHDMGLRRGAAVEAPSRRAAKQEIAELVSRSGNALFDRFERRLLLALNDLPLTSNYSNAIAHWARDAARTMDKPCEVFTSKRDRQAVYDMLLAAEASDFQVIVDHSSKVGFEVRDLDGRRLYSCAPDALIDTHRASLKTRVDEVVAPFDGEGAE